MYAIQTHVNLLLICSCGNMMVMIYVMLKNNHWYNDRI